MRTPSIRKSGSKQLALFDKGIGSLGSVRYLVGEFFEVLAQKLFGGERLKTNPQCDICPDIKFSETQFAEVKGCGLNHNVIMYYERCRKYDRFINQFKNQVYYILFHHKSKPSQFEWRSDLEQLKEKLEKIIIADALELHRHCYQQPIRVVNGSHSNTKYHKGWTIGLGAIEKLPSSKVYKSCLLSAEK